MKQLILLFVFLLNLGIAFAQSEQSKISDQINTKYLEHLIKEGIDSVREAHKLNPLANDSILFIAANHHSKYLLNFGRLSHEEKEAPYKTPSDRAEYFGAINYQVAENIMYSYYNTPVKQKKSKKSITYSTYKQVANSFVTGWVNSPGHYQNIITPDLNVTAVAITVDSKTKRIYATQKFANVLFKYQFTENRQMFPYSNYSQSELITDFNDVDYSKIDIEYPHGLKPVNIKSFEYRSAQEVIDQFSGYMTLHAENNNIYLEMYLNAEVFFEFLESNKDGLAVELINYTPFDCGNPEYYTLPSRRNKTSQLSDTLLLPIYKKKMMRGFKPKRKSTYKRIKRELKKKDDRSRMSKIIDGIRMPYMPDKFKLKIAKLPKTMKSGYNEMNLVYIKNNQIYRVHHLSGVCGEYYQEFNELQLQLCKTNTIYTPIPKVKEYEFDFAFKKGQSKYNYQDLKPVLDSLTDDDFLVLEANIDAYSSVEGNATVNAKIQEERAKSIISAFQSKQALEIKPQIRTEINWDLFKEQVDSNENLAAFRGMTKPELIDTLENKDVISKLEPYFKEQRVAKVFIKTKFNLNDSTLRKFLLSEYQHYHNQLAKFSDANDTTYLAIIDTLLAIQLYAFEKVKEGILDKSILFDFPDPAYTNQVSAYVNIYYFYNFFNINENHRGIKHSDLRGYTRSNGFHAKGAYNYLRDAIKSWDAKSKLDNKEPDDILGVLMAIEANHPDLKDELEKMKINLWFKAADYHFKKDDWNKKNEYLTRIYAYYYQKEITDEHTLKLAKFFIELKNLHLAAAIISPKIENTINHDILILGAKLTYYNSIEYNNEDYASFLIDLRNRIPQEKWCGMFVGECNISFQVLDSEIFRNFYCEECQEFKNFAQTPSKW